MNKEKLFININWKVTCYSSGWMKIQELSNWLKKEIRCKNNEV